MIRRNFYCSAPFKIVCLPGESVEVCACDMERLAGLSGQIKELAVVNGYRSCGRQGGQGLQQLCHYFLITGFCAVMFNLRKWA